MLLCPLVRCLLTHLTNRTSPITTRSVFIMAHCDLTKYRVIDALDKLEDVKDSQWILDCVLDILSNNKKKNVLDKITYLLFIYQDKMQENLPILEKILNGESETED